MKRFAIGAGILAATLSFVWASNAQFGNPGNPPWPGILPGALDTAGYTIFDTPGDVTVDDALGVTGAVTAGASSAIGFTGRSQIMSTDADTTCLRDAASGATDDVCISTVGDVAAFKQGDGVTAGGITAGTVVSTSRMTFSSGSAAVPGLTFAADTNNNSGLYGAGENILGISTGGTLRMLISASDIGLANDTTLSKSIDNKNAKTVVTGGSGDVTCAGGGSATLTLANAFPVGVVKLGVSTRVTTALTGSTGYTVGDTGATDPDMYGVATTATQGTTTSPASQTVSSLGTQITAAGDVVITFVGGACTAGVIRVAAHYLLISAPISN